MPKTKRVLVKSHASSPVHALIVSSAAVLIWPGALVSGNGQVSSRFLWQTIMRMQRTMLTARSPAATAASVPLGTQGPPSQRRRK